MQVILKPVTHPELGEILIKDDLFPVGRHEPPFADYDPRLVEKLSRRHARIFEQDGIVYIADLGSLNGTSVNGAGVDTLPVRLKRGDQICFTGALCYQIEILGAAAGRQVEEPVIPVQVILTPEQRDLGLEPIVITQFPFLVNKASDVFSRYRDSLSKQVSYISRRHAHLFLKGNDVYVEDLGSTNGTFISGERLEEHARKLQEGDLLAFGGDQFVYRVGLLHLGREETRTPEETAGLLTHTSHTIEDVTRTTFVTSANSFLDIFCVESDDDSAADAGREAGGEPDAAHAATGGILRAPRVFAGEMKNALFGQETTGRRRSLLAVVLVVGLALSGVYLANSPEREIHRLMEDAEYAAAVDAANRYLDRYPDDLEIRAVATEAVLKQVVPDWIDSISAGQFDAALQAIDTGRRASAANPDAGPVFDELTWVTRLERFVAERGGVEQPVIMFVEEEQIKQLVEAWESDARRHRRTLAGVVQDVPEFSALREQIFSHIRALQNQRSLSVAAIERLLSDVNAALQGGSVDSVMPLIDEFEQTYPRIHGVDGLRNDLRNYRLIVDRLRDNDWIEAHQLASETDFETPLFAARVRFVSEQDLPPQATLDSYSQARTDWQQGNTVVAIAALEPLVNERFGEVAERRLRRYRQVAGDYAELATSRDKPEYDHRLLAFYRTLDPEEDVYFRDAVQQEFRVYRSQALKEADALYKSAADAWQRYRRAGGIRGLHRLESGVSSTYKQRAGELARAADAVTQAREIMSLVDADSTPERVGLSEAIANEVRLQRQSLVELGMVLEPSLMRSKLELLPVMEADAPGAEQAGISQ